MKRYVAFAGEDYYPSGGASDFVGAYDNEMDARLAVVEKKYADWGHVFDMETCEIIWTLDR